MSEMFEGLSPEVEGLLNAAKSDLPVAQADAGLLEAMVMAMSVDTSSPSPAPRRRSMIGKVVTAKVAAIAGVMVLSSGVAAAATGALPDSAQDAASNAAEHVGLHIPKSEHGAAVSGVAHDKDGDGDQNHGSRVCAVASEGKCQSGDEDDDTTDTTVAGEHGNSADHRQDGDHRQEADHRGSDETTTTVNDDGGDDSAPSSHPSGDDHPSGESNPGSGHHGSDD